MKITIKLYHYFDSRNQDLHLSNFVNDKNNKSRKNPVNQLEMSNKNMAVITPPNHLMTVTNIGKFENKLVSR